MRERTLDPREEEKRDTSLLMVGMSALEIRRSAQQLKPAQKPNWARSPHSRKGETSRLSGLVDSPLTKSGKMKEELFS